MSAHAADLPEEQTSYTALQRALKTAETALRFYEMRVTEAETLVALHRSHVASTKQRIAGLKQALETHP